ncbi:hypothetical protein ABZ345_18985 [Lentzea sp. NPDC005914]
MGKRSPAHVVRKRIGEHAAALREVVPLLVSPDPESPIRRPGP